MYSSVCYSYYGCILVVLQVFTNSCTRVQILLYIFLMNAWPSGTNWAATVWASSLSILFFILVLLKRSVATNRKMVQEKKWSIQTQSVDPFYQQTCLSFNSISFVLHSLCMRKSKIVLLSSYPIPINRFFIYENHVPCQICDFRMHHLSILLLGLPKTSPCLHYKYMVYVVFHHLYSVHVKLPSYKRGLLVCSITT